MSMEQLAAMEFEPWVKSERVPSNKGWTLHAPPARAAHVMHEKTKAELIEVVVRCGPDLTRETVERLYDARDWFLAVAAMIESAEQRLRCAAAVVELRDNVVPFKPQPPAA